MPPALPAALRKLFHSRAAIFLVAFLLPFAAILIEHSYIVPPDENHFYFGAEMGRVAMAVASGQGYSSPLPIPTGPTALVPPAYTLLAALVFKIFGVYSAPSAFVLLTLNCLFTAFTALALAALGSLLLNDSLGSLAGWAWALYPYSFQVNPHDFWETSLTTLLVALLFLIAFRLSPQSPAPAWLGFGALGALATLSNTSASIASGSLWIFLAFRLARLSAPAFSPSALSPRRLAPLFKPLALTLAGFLLLMSPWWLRNYSAFGKFIPLRSNFWLEIWVGNCFDRVLPSHGSPSDYFSTVPYNDPQYWANDRFLPNSEHPCALRSEAAEYARLGELPYIASKRRVALACLAAHPARFLRLTLRRIAFTWTSAFYILPEFAAHHRAILALWIAGYSLLSLFAFAGLVQLSRLSRESALPFALLLLLYPAIYYITHQTLRFRYPIDPEIVLLACLAVFQLFTLDQKREPVPAVEIFEAAA